MSCYLRLRSGRSHTALGLVLSEINTDAHFHLAKPRCLHNALIFICGAEIAGVVTEELIAGLHT